MRKTIKIFHSLASCGLVGGLAAYMIVLLWAPQATAAQVADMRATIAALSNYILVPSLGVALVTGLVAMMVQRAFQGMRWVWVKAVLGLAMFEATLAVIQGKANFGLETARKVAEGTETVEALEAALSSEWTALSAIMALSLAQVILGVWRPALKKRPGPAPARAGAAE
ncbi:MAG: DUF2269 family protein [Beijerinckiaceae bacterium]